MSLNQDIRSKYASKHISNVVFYIPFSYYYVVRLGTIPKWLSWALIYLFPTCYYSALTYQGDWCAFAVNYLLILLATFSLYELGYILNDTMGICREKYLRCGYMRRIFYILLAIVGGLFSSVFYMLSWQ